MGDIVNSSDAPSANGLHRTFNMAVEEANRRHAKDILSRLTITLGDEFQG
ncbi:SatD family protein [Novosphingobium pokkalii]